MVDDDNDDNDDAGAWVYYKLTCGELTSNMNFLIMFNHQFIV